VRALKLLRPPTLDDVAPSGGALGSGLVDQRAQTEAEPLEAGLEVGHLSNEPHGLLACQRSRGAGGEHGQAASQVFKLATPVHRPLTLSNRCSARPEATTPPIVTSLPTLVAMATTYDVLRKLMAGADVPDLEELVPRPAWMRDGACTDQSLTGVNFFPGVGEPTGAAKAVCARCTVREQCLEFALQRRELHGVWGGTSLHQRRDIRRERLKSRAA